MLASLTLWALAAVLQSVTATAFITSPSKVLRVTPGTPHVGSAALPQRDARARALGGAGAGASMLAARPKIAFIQTGGTIDKDYPRSTMGYAFEIADAATERIIADASHVPLGVDVDFHTACRKVTPLLAPTGWRRRPL
jgi:L-asparaginase/Glu-tRNA(Gln) amidotransferase subunit D